MLTRFLSIVALCALFAAAVNGRAEGHTKLMRAEPKPGATVRAGPKAVRLWFGEELDRAAAHLAALSQERTMRRALPMTIFVIVALAAAGCGRSGPSSTRPRSTATIAILSPVPGQVVRSGQMRVRLKLEGGRIIPETRFQLTPDEGHIHLRLDGQTISMTYGVDQVVAVPLGPHLLEAEFVAADHLPFEPRVISTVTFRAQ